MSRLRPVAAVWLMAAAWTGVFAYLSILRHRAFWTGRFDVGNMVQAVWSTAHGHPLETTDQAGQQFVRLGAHVDPVLVLFAPLAWTGHLPEAMLAAQAFIVSLGALPAYWLGRRWLGDDRLAVAAAAVYLLYPPIQWATLTEFHPVTLAAPLLLFCIWAAEERRTALLAVLAVLTALTKEEVGLALAVLGIWIVVRGLGRRTGIVMTVASLVWVAIALKVIIPYFNDGRGTEFGTRYSLASLGDALSTVWRYDHVSYLAALLIPLLFLPLLAPLLAAGAVPELLINLLTDYFPQYSIEFQYVAVEVPFLVAAAILGLARLRRRLPQPLARSGVLAALWVGAVLVAGIHLGPLPWWGKVPEFGSTVRNEQFDVGAHAAVMARAVAMIPDGVPVSAGNLLGSHLSERRRMYTFPVLGDARWIVVDARRPYLADKLLPKEHAVALVQLESLPGIERVFNEDGVSVFRRAPS